MANINRPALVNLLKEGVVTVEFKKLDGSERTMKATLDVEVLKTTLPLLTVNLSLFLIQKRKLGEHFVGIMLRR